MRRGKRNRRVWNTSQKLRILQEVAAARASGKFGAIAEVCRKYDIETAHLVIWRRELEKKGLL